MPRTLSLWMEEDHRALRTELVSALSGRHVALASFDRFRHHLLWHVSVEERLVMPALIKQLGHAPEYAAGLRKDHAGIAALCVPRPEREWVENLRDLLDEHYRVEEGPGGVYELCDRVMTGELQSELVEAIERHPAVHLGAFAEGPSVRAQLNEVLRVVGISAAPRRAKK